MRAKAATGDPGTSAPPPGSTSGPSTAACAHAGSSSLPSIVGADGKRGIASGSPVRVASPKWRSRVLAHDGSGFLHAASASSRHAPATLGLVLRMSVILEHDDFRI